jgi:integrase
MALPPHVHCTVARGRDYYAYHPFRGTKRAGERVALPGAPTLTNGEPNPEWWAAYRAASGAPVPTAAAGTFRALAIAWSGGESGAGSPEWRAHGKNTRRNYRTGLARILTAWGEQSVRAVEPRHVLELRNSLQHLPEAANTMIKALASMISWSIPNGGWRADNPCDHVKMFPKGTPWAAWSWEAIEAWRDLAVPEMRLALMLALYTGQRQSDLIRMSWNDVDQGAIQVVQEDGSEGQKKTKKKVWVPIHRNLKAELDRVQRRSVRILTGQRGLPLTIESFKTAWQRQHECIELMTGACHGLVPHGLRKSAVCFLLEAGCSEEEVEAITRQSREMIRHYALELKRHKLAERAIGKWEDAMLEGGSQENGT